MKVKNFIKLCTRSPLQLSSNLKQLQFKLLSPFSQESVLKLQCSNGLISFVKLCGKLLSIQLNITQLLGGQPIQFLMLLENIVQFFIGYMGIILIVHFLKLRVHQVLFIIHCFLVASLYNFSCFLKTLYNFSQAMWVSS